MIHDNYIQHIQCLIAMARFTFVTFIINYEYSDPRINILLKRCNKIKYTKL